VVLAMVKFLHDLDLHGTILSTHYVHVTAMR
jgi:hypothetical protein